MRKAITVFLVMICMGACDNLPSDLSSIEKAFIVMPTKYGDNVYYFEAIGADFGKSLQFFISSHPPLSIVTIAPDDTAGYGKTNGYFVVVELIASQR